MIEIQRVGKRIFYDYLKIYLTWDIYLYVYFRYFSLIRGLILGLGYWDTPTYKNKINVVSLDFQI